MHRLSVIEAFATFGATLEDKEFAYSAIAPDGSVVVSCWAHRLVWGVDGCSHSGYLSRWHENPIGKALLAKHLRLAWDESRSLRLVVVTAAEPARVDRADNLDQMLKTYRAAPEFIGRLAAFDGNDYVYQFEAQPTMVDRPIEP